MRKYAVLFLAATFFAAGAGALLFAAPPQAPEKITIRIPGHAKKPPVEFAHLEHIKFAGGNCLVCHHQGISDNKFKCTECHTAKRSEPKVPAARAAFHKQCTDCHAAKEKGPRYPRDCLTCHKVSGQ